MPLTPETLPRHELAGLDVRVVSASDPSLVDRRGEVVVETTRTLGVEGADRVWHVPKDEATFEFAVPADDPDADARRVTVEGSRLVARPARRTEQTGDSIWR